MGPATVGRIGYESRFDYTAIGSVVNLASRLCASAADREILVDTKIAEAVGDRRAVIPLGTRLFVPGDGPGVAADVGAAIKGNIIDLWMPSTAAARAWGRRTVTITVYG